MTDLRKGSIKELREMEAFFVRNGNLSAASYVSDHIELYGADVEVVKGRKVPIGTTGNVFWMKGNHYGNDPWSGHVTTVGIKTADGQTVFTSAENLEIINPPHFIFWEARSVIQFDREAGTARYAGFDIVGRKVEGRELPCDHTEDHGDTKVIYENFNSKEEAEAFREEEMQEPEWKI